MGPMIARRLLVSMPALVGVLFLCFCLLQVVPTDPALIIAGPDAKAEVVAGDPRSSASTAPSPDPVLRVHRPRAQGDLGRSIISNKSGERRAAPPSAPPPN
jgi:glutathione transport system permease protein